MAGEAEGHILRRPGLAGRLDPIIVGDVPAEHARIPSLELFSADQNDPHHDR